MQTGSGSDQLNLEWHCYDLSRKWISGFAQAAGSPVAVGGFPKGVTSGDFNLDGKPDLAVANQSSSNLTILLGMEVVVLLRTSSPMATGPNPNW
jgi:hypothetical protein